MWISTIHGSKGLEYKVVFILDANEGVIPHRRSVKPDEIEEERRLFYVAMTRAKKHLHIYSSKKHFGKDAHVSRFVLESLDNNNVNMYPDDHKPRSAAASYNNAAASYNNAAMIADEPLIKRDKPGSVHKSHSSFNQTPAKRGSDILKNGWHL